MKTSDKFMEEQRKNQRKNKKKHEIDSSTPPRQEVLSSQQPQEVAEAPTQEIAEAPKEKLRKHIFIQAVKEDLVDWAKWTDAEKQSLEERGIETQNDFNQQKIRFFNKLTQALTLTPLDKIESPEFQQGIWSQLDELKTEKNQPIQTFEVNGRKTELMAVDRDLNLSEKQASLESYAKSFSQKQQVVEVAEAPKEKKKTSLMKIASKIGKKARAAMKRPSKQQRRLSDPRKPQSVHYL